MAVTGTAVLVNPLPLLSALFSDPQALAACDRLAAFLEEKGAIVGIPVNKIAQNATEQAALGRLQTGQSFVRVDEEGLVWPTELFGAEVISLTV